MEISCLKHFSGLFRGKTSKNNGDFYCLNCFHPYKTENKLKKHYNVYKNHHYSMTVPFIIYGEMEYLLNKMSACHDNPKKSSTTKINKQTSSGNSLFTHCSLDATKSKFDCCRGKDCMERFCKDLKEHARKIINYEKKEIIPLMLKKANHIMRKMFVIYTKKDLVLMMTIKNIVKSDNTATILENIEEMLIIFVI